MAILRLVGGTAVKGACPGSVAISKECAGSAVAASATAEYKRKKPAVAPVSPLPRTVEPLRRDPAEEVAAVSSASEDAQKAVARRLILAHIVAGKSVQTWVNEINCGVLNQAPTIFESMAMSSQGLSILSAIGICPSSGGREWGLDNEIFATVAGKNLLLKELPALKKLTIELEGLPLY